MLSREWRTPFYLPRGLLRAHFHRVLEKGSYATLRKLQVEGGWSAPKDDNQTTGDRALVRGEGSERGLRAWPPYGMDEQKK